MSNGETLQAYIQGEGHDLQEHSIVLVGGGRAQDLSVVRYVLSIGVGIDANGNPQVQTCSGALDFGGVVDRAAARSRYGGSSPRLVAWGVATNPVKQPRRILSLLRRRGSVCSLDLLGPNISMLIT